MLPTLGRRLGDERSFFALEPLRLSFPGDFEPRGVVRPRRATGGLMPAVDASAGAGAGAPPSSPSRLDQLDGVEHPGLPQLRDHLLAVGGNLWGEKWE